MINEKSNNLKTRGNQARIYLRCKRGSLTRDIWLCLIRLIFVRVVEAHTDGLAIFHEYSFCRRDSRVCKLSIRHSSLLHVEVPGASHVLLDFASELGRRSLRAKSLALGPWLVWEHTFTKLYVEISSDNFGSFYHLVYIDFSVSNV